MKKRPEEDFEVQWSILDAPPGEGSVPIQGAPADPVAPMAPDMSQSFSFDITRPEYNPRHRGKIEALASEIVNRGPFTYDPETDPLFQNYKKQYTRAGQQAMDDTIGKVAARTGGLASSYAGTAGQQAYGAWMDKLTDKVPALQQLAHQMYMDELNAKRGDLDMLMGMDREEYGRYQGDLDQYNRDRGFAFDAASLQDQREYERGRDKIADERYDREQAMAEADVMGSLGVFDRFKDLGFSDQEISIMTKAYQDRKAQEAADRAAKQARSSGGSSKGGSGKPRLTAAQTLKALEDGIVNDQTKAAYKYWFGQDWEGEGGPEKEASGIGPFTFSMSYFRHLLQMDPDQAIQYANENTEGMSDEDYKEVAHFLG